VHVSEVTAIELLGPSRTGFDRVLTTDALGFVARLVREFEPARGELLRRRARRQQQLDDGRRPDFLPATAAIRAGDWNVAPIPDDLVDRRVEITGPVDRKMIINALNSGARVFMADFEDANCPTWDNIVQGQLNLMDAVRREIAWDAPDGTSYRLRDETATLMVRPRGWHLTERHARLDGAAVSASLFDFGLFFFHNARTLVDRGSGPYFYLPKLEGHLEARLWNDVFLSAQAALGLPAGTIRATVLIETVLAAFEMDEILYELKEHSAGLNCGRWDYIFSFIKKFRRWPEFVLPDRSAVTMDRAFLRAYARLAVRTCHRRGIHAIGGMAAQIPVKNDPAANERAIDRVRADKEREAGDGHDGTWVAHPALVPVAQSVFDARMPLPNQIDRAAEENPPGAAELLMMPEGDITEAGLRLNVAVALRYLEAWLRGQGAVPIFNLMEDAATAEISRSQIWQWIRHGAHLSDDRIVTADFYRSIRQAEMDSLRREAGDQRWGVTRFEEAALLLDRLVTAEEFVEFLTLPAYEVLLRHEADVPGARASVM
jgi:malate synthase